MDRLTSLKTNDKSKFIKKKKMCTVSHGNRKKTEVLSPFVKTKSDIR